MSEHAAPGYYNIIHRPMWLTQVKENVKDFKYVKRVDFENDIKLIADNCLLYNGPHSPLSITIKRLLEETIDYLDENSEEIKRLESVIAEQQMVTSVS